MFSLDSLGTHPSYYDKIIISGHLAHDSNARYETQDNEDG